MQHKQNPKAVIFQVTLGGIQTHGIHVHVDVTQVIAFDSVDDESKPESSHFSPSTPTPEMWTSSDNPPYSYYIFYMFANITMLNRLRR